jgi:succinate dehydrogenase/fumarate reductase flavoprotein subunit
MGNSLLDFNVFGRRSGIFAAEYVKSRKVGKLTLKHLDDYNKALDDADIGTDRKAPIILPEYRGKEALARALDLL